MGRAVPIAVAATHGRLPQSWLRALVGHNERKRKARKRFRDLPEVLLFQPGLSHAGPPCFRDCTCAWENLL